MRRAGVGRGYLPRLALAALASAALCLWMGSSAAAGEGVTATFISTGQFTLQRASDGAYLLHQSAVSSFLSVRVGEQIYSNDEGTLSVTSGPTWVTGSLCRTTYSTPVGVAVTQDVEVAGDAAVITVAVANTTASAHDVGVRYLLDTKVGANDGAPLSASGVTDPTTGSPVCTHETDIPDPAFDMWYGYDRWPEATLVAVGTIISHPTRMIFAYWPEAVRYSWHYEPDPERAFYTPGETTSPASDSCVLIYFEIGQVPAGASRSVVTAYGIGPPETIPSRDLVIQRLLGLGAAIETAMDGAADAYADLLADAHERLGPELRPIVLGVHRAAASGRYLRIPPELAKVAAGLHGSCQAAGWTAQSQQLLDWAARSLLAPGLEGLTREQTRALVRARLEEGDAEHPGLAHRKAQAAAAIQAVIDALPDPLPEAYPLVHVCDQLARLRREVLLATSQETMVGLPGGDLDVSLGLVLSQQRVVRTLHGDYDALASVHALTALDPCGPGGLQLITWAGAVRSHTAPDGRAALPARLRVALFAFDGLPTPVEPARMAPAELPPRYFLGLAAVGAAHSFEAEVKGLLALAGATDAYLPAAQAALGGGLPWGGPEASPVTVELSDPDDVILSAEHPVGQVTLAAAVHNGSAASLDLRLRAQLYTPVGADGSLLPGAQPVATSATSSFSLGPGGEATVLVDLPVALSQLSGGDTYLAVVSVYRQADLAAAPAVCMFRAGASEVLGSLAGQTHAVLSSGWLTSGEVVTLPLDIPGDAAAVTLALVSTRPEADLHLYNGAGDHVGVNYDSGVVETQIAGASIGDSGVSPKVIHLRAPAAGEYTVTIVGRATAEPQPYTLAAITTPSRRALLARLPTVVGREQRSGDIASIVLLLQEASDQDGLRDLEITPSPLADGSGHAIGLDHITCALDGTAAPPGGGVPGLVVISLPPSITPGRYHGSVSLGGRRESDGVGVASLLPVALDIESFFPDVPPDQWARPWIKACARAQIVAGYPDGTYQPEAPVTRDQMAVFIARSMAGGDEQVPEEPGGPTFADVDEDHWAYRYIEYVAAHDVARGYWDNTYRPEYEVDRGQMAVFVARGMAGGDSGVPEPTGDPTFPDVTPEGDWGWCYKYVEYIASQGVTSGYWDGYHPEYLCSRDQMAVYVVRGFGILK